MTNQRKEWLNAFGQLIGSKKAPQSAFKSVNAKVKGKSRSLNGGQIRHLTEDQEQIRAVCWIEKHGIVVHHSPNGGKRDKSEACKLKAMGVRPGYPDLAFNYARKGFHGLFIEMKRREGGVLSDAQLWWRDHLIREGNAWYCAKGMEEAIAIVKDYFDLRD